jgi:DNA-binding NtrC family response regulator
MLNPTRRHAAPLNEETAPPVVLLAEAHPSLRRWLRILLVEAGYRVLEAENGAELLEHLRGPELLDVVVANTHVGRMPGWEIAQYTSQIRPGIPVVRLIDTRADAVPIWRNPDAVVILQKPFTITDLVDAVREAMLRGSEAASPRAAIL